MQTARQDFSAHERSLWGVLAHLARSGYVVPPDEGRDLIHDFYVDAWGGLRERFDPARGKFETYILGAFYQFARRRILNLTNWRARLVDAGQLTTLAADTPGPEEELETFSELRSIHEALSRLPARQREVLHDYLAGDGAGERNLALRHRLSRYKLREILIDALGRIATELKRHSDFEPVEERVAVALWHEGRTVRDVAALLRIPSAEVQEARRRIGMRLMKALRSRVPVERERGRPMTSDVLQLLKEAILSVDRTDLLEGLRRDAKAILEALDERDIEFSPQEIALLENHPAWVAAVYQALEDPDEENEIANAILEAREDEDAEIGKAFEQAVRNLPERFRDWPRWFENVGIVDEEYQAHLRTQTVVRAALPLAEGLIGYGMSPATFQGATRGMELLLNRVFAGGAPPDASDGRRAVVLAASELETGPSYLPRSLALAQIRGGPHCPPEAAEPLLRWLIEAAQLRPYWFRGYRASTFGEGSIRIAPDASMSDADLMIRWNRDASSVLEQWAEERLAENARARAAAAM